MGGFFVRLIYSDRVKQLSELLEPYWEWDGIYCRIREDAPEEIKQTEKEWRELEEKEYHDALVADGLI